MSTVTTTTVHTENRTGDDTGHTSRTGHPGSALTRTLPRTTLTSGIAAAVATTAAAALAHAAGVSLEIDGEMIPLLGFAQMTVIGAVIGAILLAVLNRFSSRARAWFVRTTVVLTVVSCIPSVAWPDDAVSAIVLVATHVLAAAMIVPALVRHARS